MVQTITFRPLINRHFILQKLWDKVFKNGLGEICRKQLLKNLKWYGLLKVVFHKFHLIHSWILCPIYPSQIRKLYESFKQDLLINNKNFMRRICNKISKLINPFVPNAPYGYAPNLTVFWCFQGVEKGCIGNEWVKKTLFNLDL